MLKERLIVRAFMKHEPDNIIAALGRELGVSATARILNRYSGKRLYFPKKKIQFRLAFIEIANDKLKGLKPGPSKAYRKAIMQIASRFGIPHQKVLWMLHNQRMREKKRGQKTRSRDEQKA
jgi:hypothetical protein